MCCPACEPTFSRVDWTVCPLVNEFPCSLMDLCTERLSIVPLEHVELLDWYVHRFDHVEAVEGARAVSSHRLQVQTSVGIKLMSFEPMDYKFRVSKQGDVVVSVCISRNE